VLVEGIGGNYHTEIHYNYQDDKGAVFQTELIEPVVRYTRDYYPLAGNIFRYVNLRHAVEALSNRPLKIYGSSKQLVGYEVNATKGVEFHAALLVGGNFHDSWAIAWAGKNLTITYETAGGSSFTSITDSSVTGTGESFQGSITATYAENMIFENVRVNGSTSKSRFRNIIGGFGSLTESVIESTDGCNGTQSNNLRNVIWLDKTFSQLKECGVTNLHKYLPFLTSEDPLHDQDNDGIPDQVDHDSDNDGFSDLQEITAQEYFDPFDATSKPNDLVVKDHDADGIPDVDDTDDDNDGISDTDEISLGTSPFFVDSDGDGVSDKVEIDYGFSALNANSTPLVGVRVGIDLSAAQFKSQDNKILAISTWNRGGVISYFYGGDNEFTCYLCTVPSDQEIAVEGTVGFDYLEIPFEFGNRLHFTAYGSGSNTISLNYGQLVNLSNGPDTQFDIHDSAVMFSDIKGFGEGNYTFKSIINSSPYSYSATYSWSYGLIVKSKVERPGSKSQIVDSHITGSTVGTGHIIRNSAITDSTASVGSGGTYFYDSYVQASRVEGTLIRSDVVDPSTSYSDDRATLFLSESYLELDGNVIQSVGTPADNLGDGVLSTVIDYVDVSDVAQTLTLDGIASPKATPYFPNGADSVILLNDVGLQ